MAMKTDIDIDALSLFIQEEVSLLNACLVRQNWKDKTAAEWGSEGYMRLMKHCLSDNGPAIECRKNAISHTRRILIARLENHDVFNKSSENLNKIKPMLQFDHFIHTCLARELEISRLNDVLWGRSEELAQPTRKKTSP